MDVPNSATELTRIARDGNGQDVLDAIEAMTAKHGPGITALMLHSAGEALERERLAAEALEQLCAFVDNLPAEGDAISGYIRGGVRYELTGAALRLLLEQPSERQVRERIAAELEQQAYREAVRDVNGTECVEAKVLFAAARMVCGGGDV